MKSTELRRFYRRYLLAAGVSGGVRARAALRKARMAMLLQVTQWHIDSLSEQEYRHWM